MQKWTNAYDVSILALGLGQLTLSSRIIECLDSTTATEFRLFNRMGETAETLPELEELQNVKEKLRSKYSRLYNLLLKITESQPIASEDMLALLYRSIEST